MRKQNNKIMRFKMVYIGITIALLCLYIIGASNLFDTTNGLVETNCNYLSVNMHPDLHEGENIQDDISLLNVAKAYSALNSCNTITNSHGLGRELGYSTNFLSTGCRQYKGFPYTYTYGATNIPYFINSNNMTSSQVTAIRAQADIWNQAIMHDGTGQIVNLFEVDNLNPING